MKLSDLILDDATGRLSHTKLANVVSFITATIIVTRVCWNASPGDGVATVLLVYLGAAGLNVTASKMIGARFMGSPAKPENGEPK